MDTKPSGGDAKRTRRRRSSAGSSSGRGLTTASSAMQHPAVSRFAPAVMAAAAALYVVGSAGWIYHDSVNYGPFVRGISKTDTRYIVGPPQVQEPSRWIYNNGDTTTTLIYGARDQAEQIHCVTRSTANAACYSFMGVGVNTTEDVIWRLMGAPDQQQYFGETKVITYNGLGVQFTLERFAVKGVALVPKTNSMLMVGQMLRMMTP